MTSVRQAAKTTISKKQRNNFAHSYSQAVNTGKGIFELKSDMSIKYALKKKLRDYLGISLKWRTPPFWEPLIQKNWGNFVKILDCVWVI